MFQRIILVTAIAAACVSVSVSEGGPAASQPAPVAPEVVAAREAVARAVAAVVKDLGGDV